MAFAVLPRASKTLDPALVFCKGTQIREVGTNDLICTANRDIAKTDFILLNDFDWNWTKPESESVVDPKIMAAVMQARYDYRREVAIPI